MGGLPSRLTARRWHESLGGDEETAPYSGRFQGGGNKAECEGNEVWVKDHRSIQYFHQMLHVFMDHVVG